MADSGQHQRSKARKGATPPEELQAQQLQAADEANDTLAWRLLSSPRTFLVLAVLLTLFLGLASFLPQRPLLSELATLLPFAWAEAAHALGLTDALVAWPTLLLVLLMVLNGGGMALATWQRSQERFKAVNSARFSALEFDVLSAKLPQTFDKAPLKHETLGETPHRQVIARRGLFTEGMGLVVLGLVALACSLAFSRSQAIEARLTVVPSSSTLAESEVRDGDTYLLRALPLQVLCERADPQDHLRRYPCQLAFNGEPQTHHLTPGQSTSIGSFELELVRERLRTGREDEAIDLVLTRNGTKQRLRVDPGQTVALSNTTERLTAFHGPDGPLVILDREGQASSLLSPKLSPDFAPAADFHLEAEQPTRLELRAFTAPSKLGALLGLLLILVGFALALLSPHLSLHLSEEDHGLRLTLISFNRPIQAARLRAELLGESYTPPTRAHPLHDELGLLLAAAGLAFGFMASASTYALPFGVAALVAYRSGWALPLGALSLVAGLGTIPSPAGLLELDTFLPQLFGGAALGFLARELGLRAWFSNKPYLLGGVLALTLAAALVAWPTFTLLAHEGAPLLAPIEQMDGASARHVLWDRALFLPEGSDCWALVALGLSLVAAVWLFAVQLSTRPSDADYQPHPLLRPRVGKWVLWALALTGLALGVRWLLGVFSAIPLDNESLRHSLQTVVNRETSLLALWAPEQASLALWSRPIVEALCLVSGVGLLVLALQKAQPKGTGVAGYFWPIAALLSLSLSLGWGLLRYATIEGTQLMQLAAVVLLAASLVASLPRKNTLSTLPLLLAGGLLAASWLFVPLFNAP